MRFSDYNNDNIKQDFNIGNNDVDQNKIEELYNQYSGFSNEQLMKEFFRKSVDLKQNGSLDENKLNAIKQSLLPYLTDEQIKSLNKILDLVSNV